MLGAQSNTIIKTEASSVSEGGDTVSDFRTTPTDYVWSVPGPQRKGRALPMRVMADFNVLIYKVGLTICII